jgi:hypothetical protein
MEVFTKKLKLPSSLPMGGYEPSRLSKNHSDELEINSWKFTDEINGGNVELCSIDALYAGDLTSIDNLCNLNRIFAASHTHYAPMLDSKKKELGFCSKEALQVYLDALKYSNHVKVKPDTCRVYRSEVNVPVYRRFDFPNTIFNRFLSKYGGMYPNEKLVVDRNLYLFEFSSKKNSEFIIVYHACHPVSRKDPNLLSSDYIGQIRKAVRERFKVETCLFLLGCAGDIRPNFPKKRLSWLPRSRLNWRFEYGSKANELAVDSAYQESVHGAKYVESIQLINNSVRVDKISFSLLAQGNVIIPRLTIGKRLSFEFVPFEVSHLFHMEAQQKNKMRFIVSCANDTLGYLPHPQQIIASGYEVDGSRKYMGLRERVELTTGCLW